MSRKTTRNALGAVEKLIEQRRLFQDWIEKLDAGVEGMPPRVVERVRNDYRSRLERVLSELGDQQDAVRDALLEAEGRHAALEAQQQEKKEELAELKLRRHVGEVEDQAFKEAASALKAAIDALSKDLAVALKDMERFEEILEIILRAEEPVPDEEPDEPEAPPAPPPPPPAPVAAAPEPEPVDEGEVILPIMEEPEPGPAPRMQEKTAVEDELAFLRSVTSPIRPGKMPRAAAAEGPRAEVRPPPPAPEPVAVEPSASRKSAEMQAPVLDAPPEELVAAAHMVELPQQQDDEPPPAAEAQPEAEAKGIVCGECGATNRPTEWYCEKCGAELSAL